MDKLIRSKRKTLAIEISKKGEVIVRAPLRMAEWRIEKFIVKNRKWIAKNQAEVQAKVELTKKRFEPGEKFLYLGEWQEFDFFIDHSDIEDHSAHFESWYKDRARNLILLRVADLASQHGYEYAKVRLSNARRSWGTCSGRNHIGISWRLIMAPPQCLDYVIVHELVHTMHKHHGVWFWKRVERAMPDYRQHRKWLRDNEHLLTF